MGYGFPQKLSFQWKVFVEKVEDYPLCRIILGHHAASAFRQVLFYDFWMKEDLAQARRLLSELGKFPWFETVKTMEMIGVHSPPAWISVETIKGPPLQEVLTEVEPAEQIRLCLELAKAIAVLHQVGLCHGNLDGDQVTYDPVHAIPIIRRTVCGFYKNQVADTALPPERRSHSTFVSTEKDDVWQFGALFLKRLAIRNSGLSKLVFWCTHPQPDRRPDITWVVKELAQVKPRSWRTGSAIEPQNYHSRIRRLGLGILLIALILALRPSLLEPETLYGTRLTKGTMPLVFEAGTGARPRTLGESALDLSILLGKPIIMDAALENLELSPKTWMIWDQMLKEMGLTWRLTHEGSIEILEQGTMKPSEIK